MSSPSNRPALTFIHDGKRTLGFTLTRGVRGVEAYTAAEESLGLFADQAAAVKEICTVSAQAGSLPSPLGDGKSKPRN
jgi:hypothetical protein